MNLERKPVEKQGRQKADEGTNSDVRYWIFEMEHLEQNNSCAYASEHMDKVNRQGVNPENLDESAAVVASQQL